MCIYIYIYILVWINSVVNSDVKCWKNNCFYALIFLKSLFKKMIVI